jgi:hypothetical protein
MLVLEEESWNCSGLFNIGENHSKPFQTLPLSIRGRFWNVLEWFSPMLNNPEQFQHSSSSTSITSQI